jgi:MFS family permease
VSQNPSLAPLTELTTTSRYVILIVAFLGWMFSGFQMAVMTLSAPSATKSFFRDGRLEGETVIGIGTWKTAVPLRIERLFAAPALPSQVPPASEGEGAAYKKIGGLWFSWYNAGFLFGAAAGGFVFGWMGDRAGRVRAMGASIFCFAFFSGLGYFATTAEQLLLLRFLSGMGVGGMWPTGVALASEAWSDASRPMISGLLGTSANVGLVFLNALAFFYPPVPEEWRWLLLVCAAPLPLALFVWTCVPESRSWLAARNAPPAQRRQVTVTTVFRPPLLRLTLIGIAVGTVPVLGGWGATQWLIPWTNSVVGPSEPQAMALTAVMRSGGAIIGGLAGGWIASLAGRRVTYFLVSLATLALGEFIYLVLTPKDPAFWPAVFMLGVISTIFFGWLPLYLPELFPTEARSTGAGVSFNWGRILAAIGVLFTGILTAAFGGDYGRAGSITTLIYAVGMVIILFAPDTTKKRLQD